jgi:hypothetical protein
MGGMINESAYLLVFISGVATGIACMLLCAFHILPWHIRLYTLKDKDESYDVVIILECNYSEKMLTVLVGKEEIKIWSISNIKKFKSDIECYLGNREFVNILIGVKQEYFPNYTKRIKSIIEIKPAIRKKNRSDAKLSLVNCQKK